MRAIPQFKVKAIKNYAVTRDVILENLVSHKTYQVFDDSDVTGNNDFDFMKIGEKYDVKIGVMGRRVAQPTPASQPLTIVSSQQIGAFSWVKVVDENKTELFVHAEEIDATIGQTINYEVGRYNLLQVDNTVNQAYADGGDLAKLTTDNSDEDNLNLDDLI